MQTQAMHTHDIIVIGASAGGVEALKTLVAALSSDLEVTLFVVLHVPSYTRSFLPHILQQNGLLPATHPHDGEVIRWNQIYVAPPDRHLVLSDGKVHLSKGPRENGFRPAIDPLFHSAARTYKSRVIGIILSGTLGDGVGGLKSIKSAGGIAIVQDPQEAIFSEMPLNAIKRVTVDYVLPVADIPFVLRQLTTQRVQRRRGAPMADEAETGREIVKNDMRRFETRGDSRLVSVLTCPECGGVMWELDNAKPGRYHCHIGHAFPVGSLRSEQTETLEVALWSAIRALEERAALLKRMAVQCQDRGSILSAQEFSDQVKEAEQNADVIRTVFFNGRKSATKIDEEANNE